MNEALRYPSTGGDCHLHSGIAIAALGVAYFLRAVGDAAGSAGPGWLSWASPIGWVQQIRPFAGDVWWVVTLPFVAAAGFVIVAIALSRRRDLGAGILRERVGPAAAHYGLRGVGGLAWRLNRAALFGWASGFLVMGLVLGSLAGSIGKFLDNPRTRDVIASLGGQSGIANAFFAAEFAVAGVVASAYAVSTVMRLHTEERALRVEPLLAGAIGRPRLLVGYLFFAAGGTALLLLMAGAAAGLVHGLHTGQVGAEVMRLAGAALSQLPAAWVLAGLTATLLGIAPRWAALAWTALGAFLLIGEFGPLLGVPQWTLDLSPFSHLPKLPGGAVEPAPLIWLTALGVGLAIVGIAAFQRRDISVEAP